GLRRPNVITLLPDTLKEIIAEARLAPSVHNVQPSRWRPAGDQVLLLGDTSRAIPVADPTGRDWRLSHGAHFEGLAMALARRGAQVVDLSLRPEQPLSGGLMEIAQFAVASGGDAATAEPVEGRMSWRGSFKPVDEATRFDLARLAGEGDDVTLVTDREGISDAAGMGDRAALHFLRDEEHRAELLMWMRLSRHHPGYRRDGLNAAAMHMSPVEAWGAGLVLGPLFRPLDRLGMAA